MRTRHSLNWFSHCLLFLIPLAAFGQTTVSGPVFGTWTIDAGPYIVESTITVEPGATLIIEPGVNVFVSANASIDVYGILRALGTADEMIYFQPYEIECWNGISFLNGSSSECLLQYVQIEKPPFAVYMDHCSPTIRSSIIYAKYIAAKAHYADFIMRNTELYADEGDVDCVSLRFSDADIRDCEIYASNLDTGIDVVGIYGKCSDPEINYTEIIVDGTGTSYGLWLEDVDKGQFNYDLMYVRSKNQANGMSLNHCTYPSFVNNTVVVESDHFSDKGAILWLNSNPLYLNCIVYGDMTSQGVVAGLGCFPEIKYTDIYNNTDDVVGCVMGEGCFSRDPLFEDATAGDFDLTEYSPCINAGDPESPLDPDNTRADMGCFYFDLINSMSSYNPEMPVKYNVIEAFPSPFNASSSIQFELASDQFGRLAIYNQQGRMVDLLKSGKFNPGSYDFNWDASRFSSGIYLAVLKTNRQTSIQQLILIK